MTSSNTKRQRAMEGHFACGSGLLIESDCLGQTYASRASGRDLTVSMPQMPSDWQGDGFLEPPKWAYNNFSDDEQRVKFSDDTFRWGATSGFKNNDDGTQSPEFARVLRWGFQTSIDAFTDKLEFFNARSKAVGEIEAWWDLVSSWISVFTKQDFVQIGKTGSGIRVGPIITWCGDDDQQRVNGSRDTSIPVVNDEGVDRLGDATLRRCLDLASRETPPPDEWLFIRDARSLVNANQHRRAVIDACTATELSLTALIDTKLIADGVSEKDRKKKFKDHHGIFNLKELHKKVNAAGTVPKDLVKEVGTTRNKAAHAGYKPTPEETNTAIETAVLVVEQAFPLTNY